MTLASMHPAVTAIPVGIAFGAVLERAGLGDARVIRGHFIGADFSVILVMFGAIVTAMLGLLWADALGVVQLDTLAMPPTDLGAQAVGAIIFGGGFGIASLCPGTACVAAASGRRDGVVAMVGILIGTILTAVLWPALGSFAAAVPAERRTLPSDLGLPVWVVAVAIVLLAIGCVRLARWWTEPERAGGWWRLSTLEAIGLTLAVAYAGVEGRPSAAPAELAALSRAIEREEDHVDPIELAEWIKAGRADLRIIDVRDDVDSTTYVIPNARVVPFEKLATFDFAPGDFIVLYSDGGTHAAQGWVLLRMRGLRNVRVLKDGMAAWEDEVLAPALPGETASPWREQEARIRELSLWFGGHPRAGARASEGTPSGATPRKRRRNTC